METQITDDLCESVFAMNQVRICEGDLRVAFCIEKRWAPQIFIARFIIGIDATDIDVHTDTSALPISAVHEPPEKTFEVTDDPGQPKQPDLKSNRGIAEINHLRGWFKIRLESLTGNGAQATRNEDHDPCHGAN